MAKKVLVEFVNTCPHCAGYERDVRNVAARFGEGVALHVYTAGKDFDYVRRYGVITRGTLIVDGVKRFEEPTRTTIERAIAEAVGETSGC
jgi:hypothetical protein